MEQDLEDRALDVLANGALRCVLTSRRLVEQSRGAARTARWLSAQWRHAQRRADTTVVVSPRRRRKMPRTSRTRLRVVPTTPHASFPR